MVPPRERLELRSGDGRPTLIAEQAELLPVPLTPLTPIDHTRFDRNEVEDVIAYADQTTRQTMHALDALVRHNAATTGP